MLVFLPFEIVLEIFKKLCLKDLLSLSKACTKTFDVVQYVFAHRSVLDFHSLHNFFGFIDMQDDEILSILRAHPRATDINNFHLPPWFSSFENLSEYFSLYLSPAFRGHATGQVQRIRVCSMYTRTFPSARSLLNKMYEMLSVHDNFTRMLVIQGEEQQLYGGWSTTNVDQPFQRRSCTYSTVVEQLHINVLYCGADSATVHEQVLSHLHLIKCVSDFPEFEIPQIATCKECGMTFEYYIR